MLKAANSALNFCQLFENEDFCRCLKITLCLAQISKNKTIVLLYKNNKAKGRFDCNQKGRFGNSLFHTCHSKMMKGEIFSLTLYHMNKACLV